MATGVYIHFPFCLSRCSYCDFATGIYESQAAEKYVCALVEEIQTCAEINESETADTIYLGGGTPSLLQPAQLHSILEAVRSRFGISSEAEITIEMNPGAAGSPKTADPRASLEVLQEFGTLGINRVSFGAQSFHDPELARLGRAHDAAAITETLHKLREAGFHNVSFDLIAGLPGQTIEQWQENVAKALALRPEHLSFYLLEVHAGTPLAQHINRGIQPKPDDDLAGEMYAVMLEQATAAGYEHYEISNLCLPGFASRHNTKYWTGERYLGFGCSAHSYDGTSRRWSNERDAMKYVARVTSGSSPIVETVNLSPVEIQAEAMFLGLRMMSGINANQYRDSFGIDVHDRYRDQFARFHEAGLIEWDGDFVRLTRSGALLSNEVFSAFV